ncbi:YcnI family protein [Cellulomonas sp.]|uniref:YcnI family copper-binding membrane protein n=1 Tax=Cellulomonas sp. TaxID=40001 RepID=UPI001B29142F|nr:YcnI family protein [Cellulomonas sp.]MBO9554538.1 YcnI family protein [Cellulomonas sp.]
MPSRIPTRATLALAAAAALTLLPTAAQAHVRVVPESTTAGGWTVLTFRVPTESDTASTTSVTVDLPLGTPLAHVATKQVPGWTATVVEADLPEPVDLHGTTLTRAPAHVTWTADPGSEIAPGEFQEFALQVGPLPDAGTALVLPAHQSYSDGTVVDWDDAPVAGGEEPESPAPAFTTTADEEGAPDVAPVAATTSEAHPAAEPDDLGRVLGAAGLGLGIVALVVALVAARRRGSAA